ncbi:MAG: hypothetical protein AB1576_12585 [Bacillota bacterium]
MDGLSDLTPPEIAEIQEQDEGWLTGYVMSIYSGALVELRKPAQPRAVHP